MKAPDLTQMDFTQALQDRLDRLQYWRAYIEKALKRSKSLVSYTDLVQSIIMGNRLFFDNGNAFAIIQPDQNTAGLGYFIYCAGGNYSALCDLEATIVEFAKAMGAIRLSTMGRHGFTRRKRPDGWEPTNQMYFVKELS